MTRTNYYCKTRPAFTIVELLIVVVVIAILAAITIVSFNGIQASAQDSRRAQDMASIKKALLAYNVENSGVPAVVSYYGGNGPYAGWDSSIDSKWLSFLRPKYGNMPVDPVNKMDASYNAPSGGNFVYYYHCYIPPAGGRTTPVVVIGYHKKNSMRVQDEFDVDRCLL